MTEDEDAVAAMPEADEDTLAGIEAILERFAAGAVPYAHEALASWRALMRTQEKPE